MKKEHILDLPLFPNMDIDELSDDTLLIESAVYVHLDCEETVEVYLQPVSSEYIKTNRKIKEADLVKEHLSSCLRVAKYCNMTPEYANTLPHVTSLDKRDINFLRDLHYHYT